MADGDTTDSHTTSHGDWVGVVANAGSGRGHGKLRVAHLVEELQARGLRSRIAWTPSERAALVAEAGDDPHCRCLVAVGGDGTVNALVNDAPRVPITVLPAGTENLFARHFGMKSDPTQTAATAASGRALPTDVGRTPGRRFTLMAGFGFDADVVSRHHASRVRGGATRPTHRVLYVDPVLRSSFQYKFPPISVQITDAATGLDETLVGTTVFIFNLPMYALGLPFAPTATGDDGLLDVVVFRHPGPFRALHYLCLVVLGLHLDRPDVLHRKVRRAVVTTTDLVPVQLDGDPAGYVDASPSSSSVWSTDVLPGAITVRVPEGFG
jgi:diacylglycerol kinase (ATP)